MLLDPHGLGGLQEPLVLLVVIGQLGLGLPPQLSRDLGELLMLVVYLVKQLWLARVQEPLVFLVLTDWLVHLDLGKLLLVRYLTEPLIMAGVEGLLKLLLKPPWLARVQGPMFLEEAWRLAGVELLAIPEGCAVEWKYRWRPGHVGQGRHRCRCLLVVRVMGLQITLISCQGGLSWRQLVIKCFRQQSGDFLHFIKQSVTVLAGAQYGLL